MTPPHVLHLIETAGPGGAETVMAELVARVPGSRYRSLAVIPSAEGWLGRTIAADRQRPVAPTPVARSGPIDLPYVRALRALVREVRPAVVHAHSFDAALYGALALRGLPGALVATFHGASDLQRHGFKARLKWLALRRAAALVCVSDALVALGRRTAGPRHDTLRMIHNGIDLAAFAAAPHARLRAQLGVAPDTLLLGAVGNVRGPKAYDVLLEAIAAVRAAGTRVHLAIAGDDTGPLADRLRAQRATLGLDATVSLVGFLDDVPEFLNGLDLFVLSSRSEGFSLATVQALACGLPVLATRSGGPEEIVEAGVSGLLVEAGSVAALTKGILSLAHDPTRRAALAAQARPRALDAFSVEAMVAHYLALYDEVRW